MRDQTGGLRRRFDGNAALRRQHLDVWLTDRSAPDGGWGDGRDPHLLIDGSASPILCLTHPNNLASGPRSGSTARSPS